MMHLLANLLRAIYRILLGYLCLCLLEACEVRRDEVATGKPCLPEFPLVRESRHLESIACNCTILQSFPKGFDLQTEVQQHWVDVNHCLVQNADLLMTGSDEHTS